MVSPALSGLFGIAGLWYLAVAGVTFRHLRWVHRLPPKTALLTAGSHPPALPACTVVLAARDEAARIGETLRRILAQEGVELEVIVVDDRSSDGTGEVVKAIAHTDARLRLLRVDVLPEGWLGKCHACHLAAQAARGKWILFTDADCWLKPDVLWRALTVAQRENADHITLTPGVLPETLGARAWHLGFMFSVASWISRTNREVPGGHLGIGAFNLVRKAAYQECGGYERLHLTVVDDVKLGLLLSRAGKRTRAFLGGDDAECHWGTTLSESIRLMEKNYFAALNYHLGVVCSLSIVFGCWLLLFIGPFTGTVEGCFAGLSLLSFAGPSAVLAKRLGWRAAHGLLMPYIFPALIYAIFRSAALTLWRGGVRWRDTFYPLAELRKHNVQ